MDLAATAGLYSSLAAIVAGFSFAAALLLITNRLGRDGVEANRLNGVILVLIATFLTLVLTSLGNAVLAASEISAGRAASEVSVLGAGFVSAGILALYTILQALEAVDTGARDLALFVRRTIGRVVTPLFMFYISSEVGIYLVQRHGEDHVLMPLDYLGLALVAILVLIGGLLYPLWARGRALAGLPRRPMSVRGFTRVFLGVSFASSGTFACMDQWMSPCTSVTPVLEGAVLIVTFASLAFASHQLAVGEAETAA